jgi:hypothetical protein
MDFGDVDHDMFTIWGTEAFGNYSIVRIEQKTGAASDGEVLSLAVADNIATVDQLAIFNGTDHSMLLRLLGTGEFTNTLASTDGFAQWLYTTVEDGTGATDTDGIFEVITNGTMDADQDIFNVVKGTTTLFSVDEDGDLAYTGKLYAPDLGVIDFDAGDATITHSTANLTVAHATGDLVISAAANNQDITLTVDDDGTDWSIFLDGSAGAVVIGSGAAFDHYIKIDAATADGTITWDQDPGEWDFTADIKTTEDILIGNDKYIGSTGDPLAIQIEDDGDIVLTDDIKVGGGDITTGDIALVIGDGTTDSVTISTDSTGTAEVALPAGSIDGTEILDGTIGSADIGTIVDSIAWNAGGITSDGTNCAAAAKSAEVLVPQYTIVCAMSDDADIYGSVTMPDSWDGGTVTFELTIAQIGASTHVVDMDFAAYCVSSDEGLVVFGATPTGEEQAAVTMTADNDILTAITSAVTVAGTSCAGGDTLFWTGQVDATASGAEIATAMEILGVKMEYTSNVGD